jgi:hypothetical protein
LPLVAAAQHAERIERTDTILSIVVFEHLERLRPASEAVERQGQRDERGIVELVGVGRQRFTAASNWRSSTAMRALSKTSRFAEVASRPCLTISTLRWSGFRA